MSGNKFDRSKTITFSSKPLEEEDGQLKLIGCFVAIPGAVGGFAKAAWEAIDPNLLEQPTLAIVPVYGFLGAVSSVLAIAVISDAIKKTQLKLIGISLACGLVFPTVLASSASIVRLQTELKQETSQSQQLAKNAARSIADVTAASEDVDVQLKSIADLKQLAISSNDPEVRNTIIRTLANLADTASPIVKTKIGEAISAIEAISTQQTELEKLS